MKRIFAFLLCIAMVVSLCPVTALAAASGTNVTLSVDKTEVNVGDTITVKLGITEMSASSLAIGFDFDNTLLEVSSITAKRSAKLDYYDYDPDADEWFDDELGCTTISTKAEANDSGHIGAVWANDHEVLYYEKAAVVTIKFVALAAGTVEFKMFEDSAGTDGYKGNWTEDEKVTVKAEETHECVDTNPKDHVCDNGCDVFQGTHADGDDANHTCDYCGEEVDGETCIDDDKNHECDECGEPVGEHKSNAEHPCQDGICAYCSQPVAATTEHQDVEGEDHECDICGAENVTECTAGEPVVTTTPATCTEEGSVVTETFCTKCGTRLSHTEDPIPAGTGCELGDPDYHWSDDYSSCTVEVKCQKGTVHQTETVNTTSEVTTVGTCQTAEVVTYYADFAGFDDVSIPVTGEKDMNNHEGEATTSYENNGENHTKIVTCQCGGEISRVTENHNFENDAHTCDCTKVQEFTLTVNVRAIGEEVKLTVPYGANLLEVLAQAAEEGKIPAIGDLVRMNETFFNGHVTISGYTSWDEDEQVWTDLEDKTMPAGDTLVDQDYNYHTGWIYGYDENDVLVGAEFLSEEESLIGWNYIEEDYDDVEGGAWYYFQKGTGDWEAWFLRAEGLTRVPYPTTAINGITYGPDADALASDPNFIDKDEAWFLFADDGKFAYYSNGVITHGGSEGRLVKGMLAWHPGMVEVTEGVYCYFIGDETNGGNILATGDVYVKRNTTDRAFVIGGIYTFGADGKLIENNGITNMTNGTKRYYVDAQLMIGNGLTKVGEKFIYVRSNGELVVNAQYYVPANTLGIVPGTYSFDANGFLVEPEMTEKDGIYYENGAWYYYENGKIGYNKGLMKVTATWYTGEGPMTFTDAIIYVRSNGQLATGTYYVTNLANYSGDDITSGMKLFFGNFGTAYLRSGIVNGYYYVDNKIAYGAGIVEIEDGKYIYVRSNGKVVVDTTYWITNVGDSGLVAKLYTFDENGILQNPEFAADLKNGIVDGYYYEDGNIVYGAGLIEYNGGYIYVRSNGQVATGKYWVTNTNGLMEAGYYVFGEDGMMIIM